MKRKWGLLLTAVLALSLFILAGCGGQSSQIQKIKDAGVLKVGVKEDVP